MQELCDLKVRVNGQFTFHLHQSILCRFSGRLRKMVRQERRRRPVKDLELKIMDFPGGSDGFETVARFCYKNGSIVITPSNLSLLHCSAIFLDMSEEVYTCNLLSQTETFMDGLFYWTWNDILVALKSCEPFVATAESSGLLEKLISALFSKISANSETPLVATAPSPSSSSSSLSREWWFDDLTVLAPTVIEKMMRTLGAYGSDNKNLILTKFLLHYLKVAFHKPGLGANGVLKYKEEYRGLADTAIHGIVIIGKASFSCRGLFWVSRVVSNLGIRKECRDKLERLMGLMLDQASLDDLLIPGHDGDVYDVNLVLRLVRVFVSSYKGGIASQRMKKVGKLIDKYLGEISPVQSLKVTKFLWVAESLPDCARDCYDGVYRALDIYLESHPTVSTEDRTSMCRCLNYEKLTLEACKDFAKNRRIPPGVAVQALASQKSKHHVNTYIKDRPDPAQTPGRTAHSSSPKSEKAASSELLDEKEVLRLNLQRMQSRVIELEKTCREMKGKMSKMEKTKSFNSACHHSSKGMPRLC
ncbi:BTB/POZ domain-containing protein At3g19850-like [Typha latifolia]|uniref:BTB/POZ domain-containing protein At3g19850-like n=1 Tax=Typha latifolia TaxID=4733 RepID=UPI003C2C3A70